MYPAIKHVFGIQTMSYLIYCLILEDVLFTQAIQKNFDLTVLCLLCFSILGVSFAVCTNGVGT